MNLNKLTNEIRERKVDSQLYEEHLLDIQEKLQTLKYATQDTHRSLLATDNYIEKYLPFKVQ
jgi:spermidine synthase